MLHLETRTDGDWAKGALRHLDEILLEQAHLEKKAAAAALAFLFRYPDEPSLQAPLAELAREELAHFGAVLGHLGRRGVAFGRQQASPYAERLLETVRAKEPQRLLDRLLCSAMIEARSCERMRLLGEAVSERDPELAQLYASLVASEARHHDLYLRLATARFDAEDVARRLAEIAAHEAAVMAQIAGLPRLHA